MVSGLPSTPVATSTNSRIITPLIELIPLAALVGVMFVVSQQTFAWGSLRVLGKVPLSDALVIAIAARIYRSSVLRTGPRLKLKEAWAGDRQ